MLPHYQLKGHGQRLDQFCRTDYRLISQDTMTYGYVGMGEKETG